MRKKYLCSRVESWGTQIFSQVILPAVLACGGSKTLRGKWVGVAASPGWLICWFSLLGWFSLCLCQTSLCCTAASREHPGDVPFCCCCCCCCHRFSVFCIAACLGVWLGSGDRGCRGNKAGGAVFLGAGAGAALSRGGTRGGGRRGGGGGGVTGSLFLSSPLVWRRVLAWRVIIPRFPPDVISPLRSEPTDPWLSEESDRATDIGKEWLSVRPGECTIVLELSWEGNEEARLMVLGTFCGGWTTDSVCATMACTTEDGTGSTVWAVAGTPAVDEVKGSPESVTTGVHRSGPGVPATWLAVRCSMACAVTTMCAPVGSPTGKLPIDTSAPLLTKPPLSDSRGDDSGDTVTSTAGGWECWSVIVVTVTSAPLVVTEIVTLSAWAVLSPWPTVWSRSWTDWLEASEAPLWGSLPLLEVFTLLRDTAMFSWEPAKASMLSKLAWFSLGGNPPGTCSSARSTTGVVGLAGVSLFTLESLVMILVGGDGGWPPSQSSRSSLWPRILYLRGGRGGGVPSSVDMSVLSQTEVDASCSVHSTSFTCPTLLAPFTSDRLTECSLSGDSHTPLPHSILGTADMLGGELPNESSSISKLSGMRPLVSAFRDTFISSRSSFLAEGIWPLVSEVSAW